MTDVTSVLFYFNDSQMSSVLLIAVVVVLLLLVLSFRGSNSNERAFTATRNLVVSNNEVFLPVDSYYAWMLLDAELAVNPIIDVAYPLPTFYTQEERIRVTELYSYDLSRAVTPQRSAPPSPVGLTNITSLVEFYFAQVLSELAAGNSEGEQPSVSNIRFSRVDTNILSLDAQLGDYVHTFYLSFRVLPAVPARTRAAVRNVGYFSNRVISSQKEVEIIQSYRRQTIEWALAPQIPEEWSPIIARSFAYWNKKLAPFGTTLVLAPEAWAGHVADPRINLICIAKSGGYTGVGTTAVDLRSGEHLWSRIAFDPLVAAERVDLFSNRVKNTTRLIEHVFIHELGHTLGLRHNFVAPAAGNSSYMAYLPPWYPNEQGNLEFMSNTPTGSYDALAIEYGYRLLPTEEMGVIPSVLAARIDAVQELFHTDENVDEDRILSRVHRRAFASGAEDTTRWLKAWQQYRSKLFTDKKEHTLDVKRTFFFLDTLTGAAANAMTYVAGFTTDYQRERLSRDDATTQVLGDAAEVLVGAPWRLTELEPHLTNVLVDNRGFARIEPRPYAGRYTIDRAPLEDLHLGAVLVIAQALFAPERVAVMDDPGSILLQFMTTPTRSTRSSIVGGGDKLHLNTVTGVLATVDFFQERYSGAAQVLLAEATTTLLAALKERPRQQVLKGMKQHGKRIAQLRAFKPPCQCGN